MPRPAAPAPEPEPAAARECAAPACTQALPATAARTGRRTCSARCRVALSQAERGVRVRQRRHGD